MKVRYYVSTEIELRRCGKPSCNEKIRDLDDMWVNVQGEYIYCSSCRYESMDDFPSDAEWRASFRPGTKFILTPHVVHDMAG